MRNQRLLTQGILSIEIHNAGAARKKLVLKSRWLRCKKTTSVVNNATIIFVITIRDMMLCSTSPNTRNLNLNSLKTLLSSVRKVNPLLLQNLEKKGLSAKSVMRIQTQWLLPSYVTSNSQLLKQNQRFIVGTDSNFLIVICAANLHIKLPRSKNSIRSKIQRICGFMSLVK